VDIKWVFVTAGGLLVFGVALTRGPAMQTAVQDDNPPLPPNATAVFELQEEVASGMTAGSACNPDRSATLVLGSCRPEGAGYVVGYCSESPARWTVGIHAAKSASTSCTLEVPPGRGALRVRPLNVESDVEVFPPSNQIAFSITREGDTFILGRGR
jgi:hypothetical protein